MPQLIEHIDAIARQKQRDVLFLRFTDPADSDEWFYDWESSESRKEIIQWLNNNQIIWQECGDVANENSMDSYGGQIYIDVLFDVEDPTYSRLAGYLENPDGSMRLPGVLFCALQLHVAMKNAHHDEPGFWDRWAENF